MNPTPANSSRFRFSLGSILMAMSALSLALGVLRVIPLSEGMRTAMLWLACVWGAAACIMIGPGWLRYRRLQRDLAVRQAEMERWAQARREQAREGAVTTTDENPPSRTD